LLIGPLIEEAGQDEGRPGDSGHDQKTASLFECEIHDVLFAAGGITF
jgi:hypothetical protein